MNDTPLIDEAGPPAFVNFIETTAGRLFICGFICNKLRDFPIGVLEPFLANIAIFSFAIAYTIQLLSIPFYELKPSDYDTFLNYRQVCLIIALIGAASSWTCIVLPHLWLECLWVFCANNLLWVFNETRRTEQDILYPEMPKNPSAYINYVLFIALAPFCSAIAGSLRHFASGLTFEIELISKISNWTLSIIGLIQLNQASAPSAAP